MNYKAMIKKQSTVIAIAVICLTIATLGVSYALFFQVETNTNNQVVTAGTLDVSYGSGSSGITATELVPMSDDEALTTNTMTGTIYLENKGTLPASYEIKLGNDTTSFEAREDYADTDELLSHEYLRVAAYVDGEQVLAPTKMSTLTAAADDNTMYSIYNGEIDITGTGNNTATVVIKVWISEEAPTDIIGDYVYLKMDVTSMVAEPKLKDAILAQYGGEDNIATMSLEKEDKVVSTSASSYINASTSYYWGTSYSVDASGNYSLAGTIVKSTLTDCRSGTNTCGNYTIKNTSSETATSTSITEVTDFKTSGNYVAVNTRRYVNAFYTATTASESGMYKAEDDYGDSYYYRGNVTNNYVQFGQNESGTSMYWRVVRVNGDGTIRMIYAGTSKVANGIANDSIIEFPYYNENYDNKMYVGYMYGTESDPYGDNTSTTLTDSDIKTSLDTWYTNNLKTNYETYIADSIFCNNREEYSDEDGYIYYKNYNRLTSTYEPVLTCSNKRDRFTVDDTTLGNGHLTNPVGLLTADEAVIAGYSYSGSTTSNYLDIQDYFWTSSPSSFDGSNAYVFGVGSSGSLYDDYVGDGYRGARPVINLKSDVEFTGTGTIDDPYVIITN